jgi:hypothetical protein
MELELEGHLKLASIGPETGVSSLSLPADLSTEKYRTCG